jgi:hypothetical protein
MIHTGMLNVRYQVYKGYIKSRNPLFDKYITTEILKTRLGYLTRSSIALVYKKG